MAVEVVLKGRSDAATGWPRPPPQGGPPCSDQRACVGGSSSLGMRPEKKSEIFLPMSPIGLSSAW